MTELPLRGPDAFARRTVKALAWWWFKFFTAFQRRTGFTRFNLAGECNQCGVCCDQPMMGVDAITWRVLWIRRAFLWWHSTVNGFDLVEAVQPGVLKFRCQYWDTKARRCTSYETRPGMCRDYPAILLYQHSPEFHQECGYRAVAANAPRLLRVLNRAELTEAKREELKKRLRLE